MHLHVLFIPEMKLGERSLACGRKKAGESVDFVPSSTFWYDDMIRSSERWQVNDEYLNITFVIFMPWYDFRGRHGVLRENKPKAEWAIDSEATRAIGMIVLVKSNLLVKNIENKKLLASLS